MSTEHRQDQLLDLLTGEIDPSEAVIVRRHLSECGTCSASYGRLERAQVLASKLPLEEPSRALDIEIIARANEKARSLRSATPVSKSWWSHLAEWLGRLPLGPQVAMGTLTVLVIAVGLLYVPDRLAREPELAGGTVVHDPAEQVIDSIEPEPATTSVLPEPEGGDLAQGSLDEARNATTGGLRTTDTERSPDSAGRRRADNVVRSRNHDSVRQEQEPVDSFAMAEPTEPPQSTRPSGSERAGGSSSGGFAPPPADYDGVASRAAPDRQVRSAPGEYRSAAPAQRSVAVPEPTPEPAPAVAAAPSGVQQDTYGRDDRELTSEQLPQARRARTESQQQTARPRQETQESEIGQIDPAQTLHQLAQSYRAQNACTTAIRHYESLLGRYPGYGGAPSAMVEVADCYRRVGRMSQARGWLERAQAYNSTQGIARREIMRLDAIDQAASIDAESAGEAAGQAAPPAAPATVPAEANY